MSMLTPLRVSDHVSERHQPWSFADTRAGPREGNPARVRATQERGLHSSPVPSRVNVTQTILFPRKRPSLVE